MYTFSASQAYLVAPLAGARIEIHVRQLAPLEGDGSPLSQGRELKCLNSSIFLVYMSRPSRRGEN